MIAAGRLVAPLFAVALLAGACGEAQATAPPIGVALPTAPALEPLPEPAVPTAPRDAPSPSSTAAPAPDPHRTWIATARQHVSRLVAYDEPDGRPLPLPFAVPNPHQFGGRLTLMVTEGGPGDDWVQVQLPIRPNGTTAWIPLADYTLSETRIHAEVLLSRRLVRVYDGPDLIAESAAVVGADETPTPLGTFYIAAKKRNDASEYYLGPWALVLSSYSEVLPEFSGGLPVIAVHGTDRPDQIGEAITYGCVRIPNDVIDFLAESVPVGAPVVISA